MVGATLRTPHLSIPAHSACSTLLRAATFCSLSSTSVVHVHATLCTEPRSLRFRTGHLASRNIALAVPLSTGQCGSQGLLSSSSQVSLFRRLPWERPPCTTITCLPLGSFSMAAACPARPLGRATPCDHGTVQLWPQGLSRAHDDRRFHAWARGGKGIQGSDMQ